MDQPAVDGRRGQLRLARRHALARADEIEP
jgi:hypothetical protein